MKTPVNIWLRGLLIAIPVWLLLTLEAYLVPDVVTEKYLALVQTIGAVHAPGVVLMLLVNPTWSQLHNYEPWHYLIGDFLFYYLLIVAIIAVVRTVRRKRTAVEPSVT